MRLSTYWLLWLKIFRQIKKGKTLKKKEQITNKIKRTWIGEEKKRRETKSKHKRQQITNRLNESHLASDTFQLYRVYLIYAPFSVYRLPFDHSPLVSFLQNWNCEPFKCGPNLLKKSRGRLRTRKKKHPQIKQMYSLCDFPFIYFFFVASFWIIAIHLNCFIALLAFWNIWQLVFDSSQGFYYKNVQMPKKKNHVHTKFTRVTGSFEVENLALVKCRCQPKLCEVQWMVQDEKTTNETKRNEMKWIK